MLSALIFLNDIKKYQVPELSDDNMVIDIENDVNTDTVNLYPSFSKSTYEFCLKLLNEAKNRWAETVINDTILDDVICLLQNRNLPYFRYQLIFKYSIICLYIIFSDIVQNNGTNSDRVTEGFLTPMIPVHSCTFIYM